MRFNYQTAALRVCVDSRDFSGRIVGQRVSSEICFSGINDFVVRVDTLLDVQKFPQAFQKLRTFTEKQRPDVPAVLSPEEMSETAHVEAQQGKEATFLLLIRSRKNASWQGMIDWLDGSPKVFFDSTLAFLKAVDEKLLF